MEYFLIIETINGTFISELKNRFLCTVKIEKNVYDCYVPSSSRLQNYINLEGHEVLLTKNKSEKGRTLFSLFAVKINGDYIMLNLNMVNLIVKQLISERKIYIDRNFQIFREKVFNDYKSDLYLLEEESNSEIIMEIKGIISIKEVVEFPHVSSDRSLLQLKKISEMLKSGKEVHYLLVSLSPLLQEIKMKRESEYSKLLKECISQGMQLKVLKLFYDGFKISHDESIEVIF